MNVVIIEGTLSRDPEPRTLASGSTLLACEVTVRDPDHPTETVPVAWFDPPASSSSLREGTAVTVTGRVRRRFFRAGGSTASRTEVVATTVVSSRQARRRATALTTALAAAGGEGPVP
jgi:single-strand DNA-binding protein